MVERSCLEIILDSVRASTSSSRVFLWASFRSMRSLRLTIFFVRDGWESDCFKSWRLDELGMKRLGLECFLR